MTVAGASDEINVVLKCLREKRNEDGFNHLWSEIDAKVRQKYSKKTLAVKLHCARLPVCIPRRVVQESVLRSTRQNWLQKYVYLEEALATQTIEWNSKLTETLQEKDFDLQHLAHQIEMLKKLSPHCTKQWNMYSA
ncbi:hypothetical protein PR048_026641 [Dryococelus australis]|uniref:Uncharacterized protein n=1 Tax=Dryococelus australis TaxID=614101 RepID=A0ABQ9GLX8_9NEOP|nr:hypothetical protein PR048_026641 [Dryococelus australis]